MVFENQVTMVTGGGQGIGRAICIRFAQDGADVAIVDVNREAAERTGRDIRELERRAVIKVTDVSDPASVDQAVREVVEELGRLDVLVNNAGIEKRAPFLEITPTDWRRQLDVNLSGTFFCTQAAAREMSARSYGRIVNLFGRRSHRTDRPCRLRRVQGRRHGLTRAAALDLADYGITVNAIAPGPIETELMLGAWTAEALRERPQHGAIARFGTVEEIADAALFLASPESGFITGVTLSVDGGAVAAGAYMVEKYRRRKAAAED